MAISSPLWKVDLPDYLFKYRAVDPNTLAIITDAKLWMAHASTFNDPFDCQPRLSLEATDREFASYLDRLYSKKYPGISRQIRRASVNQVLRDPLRNHRSSDAVEIYGNALKVVRDQTGVLSLSRRNDHMLLWGHYADSHRGICLQFQPKLGDGYFEFALPVTYQVERPTVNIITDEAWQLHEMALLTKADFWSYEEEWRLMHKEMRPGLRVFPIDALTGIILGAKISPEDEQAVREAAKRLNKLKWYRTMIDPNDFRLNIISD